MEKKILLAVDGSEKGFGAVSVVGELLKNQAGVRLILYHCVEQLARFYPGELCEVEQSCRLPLSDQEKVGRAVLDESTRVLAATGFPEDRIEVKLKVDSTDRPGTFCGKRKEGRFEPSPWAEEAEGNWKLSF